MAQMNVAFDIFLAVSVGFFAFLLLGVLRALAILRWRLDQLEATTPRRIGRNGLRRGAKAPEFTLPCTAGGDVSLRDFAGRKVLLVFTQSGCAPCHAILPELGRIANTNVQVLVVNNGDVEATRKVAEEAHAKFPILVQEGFRISRLYEVFATPFAFLIDEHGVVASQGIVTNKQYVHFVLASSPAGGQPTQAEAEQSKTVVSQSDNTQRSPSLSNGGLS